MSERGRHGRPEEGHPVAGGVRHRDPDAHGDQEQQEAQGKGGMCSAHCAPCTAGRPSQGPSTVVVILMYKLTSGALICFPCTSLHEYSLIVMSISSPPLLPPICSPPHSSSPPSSLLCPWVRCSSLPSPPLPGAVQEGPDDQERHPPPSHHGHHPRVRRQDAHGREELDRGGHRLLRRLQELRRGRCTEEDTVPQVRMSRRRRVWGWRQERRTQCLK